MDRQFMVQLENRPGELAAVARALASRGINIKSISCLGSGAITSCSLITDQEELTREVLHGLGRAYIEGATLAVDVPDRPGGLAGVVERLAAANVNVLGTLTVGRDGGIVKMAFAVDDLEKARAALGEVTTAQIA